MADSTTCSVTLGSRARSIRPMFSSAGSSKSVASGKRVSAIQNRFGSYASLSRCPYCVRFSLGCGHWSARPAGLVPETEVASCLRWASFKSGRRAARANQYRGSCCAVISLSRPVSLSPRERRSLGTLSTGRVTTLASDWQIHRFPNESQTKAIQIRGLATASVMRLAANPTTIVSMRTPGRRYCVEAVGEFVQAFTASWLPLITHRVRASTPFPRTIVPCRLSACNATQ
jgi:hypothetical protein